MTLRYPKVVFFSISVLLLLGCKREKDREKSSSKESSTDAIETSTHASISQADSVAVSPVHSNDVRPNTRGPKKKNSEFIKLPEHQNQTTERLNHEIKGININDPAFTKKLTQLWNESIAQLPVKPIPSAENGDIAKGIVLPEEILPTLKAAEKVNDNDSAEAMLCAVATWSAMMRGELLILFVNQRSSSLPPSSNDIAIFGALSNSLEELGPTHKKSPFEPWEHFSNAVNPIYRLLALKAAPYTTSQAAWNLSPELDEYNRVDASAKLGFYLGYLDEKDPIILTEAIRSLATVALPEARQAIEKFHAGQLQKGDAVLIQVAEEALRTQKLISP
jgi:hypothetical protein